jgi:hypothetical protein
VDIPLFLHVGGSVVSFWVGLFLGNRTAYHPSTRWLRLTFVLTGCYFLLRAIESFLDHPVPNSSHRHNWRWRWLRWHAGTAG